MKFIRIILLPLVPIYFIVSWIRNWLYDNNILKSKSYNIPIICVGNLSTGGTGKTPMIEYLIRFLQSKKRIATLSRGYKRTTEGFILANEQATAKTIGDEPYQFYRKFKSISVAVDGDRQRGIENLLSGKNSPNIILLDDAYQHRKVKAGLNILLTSYEKPYYKDFVLPTGNLREPRIGRKRAHIVIVTKCNVNITQNEKDTIKRKLKLKSHQSVFFSYIDYATEVVGFETKLRLEGLPKFTLVTGIANSKPLVRFLVERGLSFDHIEYPDHHNYRVDEIGMLSEKDLIITTEKDFVRLSAYDSLKQILFYLPIEVKIDDEKRFNALIDGYID